MEGLAEHARNAGMFVGARDVFEDISHTLGLSEVEVLNKSSDLEKGLASWVSEAFVAASIRVWLAGRSCDDDVDAIWEVREYGGRKAVCVEWDPSVPVDGRVGSEESGVSGL